MRRKNLFATTIILGIGVLIASIVALMAVQTARAQCGSQASSCKNCHETQAKDPVNSDGTGWHQSHAFGDFCYVCHAGNNQATDKAVAHTGMVNPMADIQTSCSQCHPNDLQARAQVYAAKLGVPAGPGANAVPAASPTPAATTIAEVAPTSQSVALAPQQQQTALSPKDANLVDYVQRYNQNVLHQEPTNWGNVILILLVILLLLAGGFFIVRREGWVSVSFTEKKPIDKAYTADVAGIADRVAGLKPEVRKSLAHLLDQPQGASEVLTALDKLTAGRAPEDES
jgi:hypothetical protein